MRVSIALILTVLAAASAFYGQSILFQSTHKGSIITVKFSPDGSKLISYSSGNEDLALWDVKTGRLLWRRPTSFIQKADEYHQLLSFAWSPDRNFLATGSANGTVQLWDAETGEFLWRADAHNRDVSAVEFSPDGSILASTSSASEADAVRLIRAADGTITGTLSGKPCTGIRIAFSKNGDKLKIGNLDGNITEWDIAAGRQVDQGPAARCREERTYDWDAAFSPDLRVSVKKTVSEEVVVKDNITGAIIKTTSVNKSKVRAAVSGDGKKAVITEYGGFHYYDFETGSDRMIDDNGLAGAFDLNFDGSILARKGEPYSTAIIVTDLETGKTRHLDGHPSSINDIKYSPDGKTLAVAGNDGNIYFFDTGGKTLIRSIIGSGRRITALAFSPDGNAFISGDEDSVLKRRYIVSGDLMDETAAGGGRDDIKKIEFAPDGRTFLVQIRASAAVYNAEKMAKQYEIVAAEKYVTEGGGLTTERSSVPINSAAFAPDGESLVTAHEDGTVRIWDARNGNQIKKFKLGENVFFAESIAKGKTLAAIVRSKKNTTLLLVDGRSGKILKQTKDIGISYPEGFSISSNEAYVAISGNTGETSVFNLNDLTRIHRLDYPYSGEDSAAFSPDGKTFFIGGENQNLFQYETATGKKLWQLLPDYRPGAAELRLERESRVRIDAIREAERMRDKQAVIDTVKYRPMVYVKFVRYGDMSDPLQKRLAESPELKESKTPKSRQTANAAWLRLYNDSPLPIEIDTESMYWPYKCSHVFPNGEKMRGLCKDSEISVRFAVKDKNGKYVPYGFDFGELTVLLPNTSAIFPVPLEILEKDYSIVFNYSFQNVRASENDGDWDYGKKTELKFGKGGLPGERNRPSRRTFPSRARRPESRL